MTFQEMIDDGYYVNIHEEDGLYIICTSQRSKKANGGMGKILVCPGHFYATYEEAEQALKEE